MEKVLVDTSGWVALLVENDQNHRAAAAVFEDLKISRVFLYTSDYVIDETITTIQARGGHRQSVLAGEVLFTSKIIKLVHVFPDHFQDSWVLYQKYADKEFSFTDVTCIAIMKDLGIQRIFTFDREFLRAGLELTPR